MSAGADIATHGPFTVTVEFVLTDGEQFAKASFDCPPGEIPSEEKLATAAANVKRQVQDQIGEQFEWPDRHTFLGEVMSERVGHSIKFAVPGPNRFAAKWAASKEST